MKLYELTEELRLLERMLDEDDVDQVSFSLALDGLNEEIKAKVANIGLLIRQKDADIEARKTLVKQLQDKNKRDEGRITWLKQYAMAHMDKDVKTPLISVSKRPGREVVYITLEADLPPKYLKYQEPVPDKRLLLEDLQAGKLIPGAYLAHGDDYLVIR